MKTMIVSPRFYPVTSGYEYYLLKVAQELVRQGEPVKVLTTDAYDTESYWLPNFKRVTLLQEELDGISISRIPILCNKWRRRMMRPLGFLPVTRFQALYRRPSFLVPGLEAALADESFDQVHIGPLPHSCMMYKAIEAGRRKKARIVATPATHLGPQNSNVVRKYYVRDYQIELLNRCDIVLTSTQAERDWLCRLGVKPEILRPYTLGIDLDRITRGDAKRFRQKYGISEPVVLFLGTQAFEKGTFHVIEAFQLLSRRHCAFRLVLAGPSLEQFRQFMRRQPDWVRERVLELGIISDTEKADALAAADLLALPSRVESFGLSYLEAWANRKPVIGAKCPATAEVIHDRINGLLVEFGDVEGLAQAIEKLLRDPSLRQKMGEEGWKKAIESHSWESAWRTLAPSFGIDLVRNAVIPSAPGVSER